jgi:hypothetical protein
MPLEDKALRLTVQREINKLTQGIDVSLMNVAVINSVVYLGGRIRPWRGAAGRGVDVKKSLQTLVDALGQLRGVTQVVVDAMVEDRF